MLRSRLFATTVGVVQRSSSYASSLDLTFSKKNFVEAENYRNGHRRTFHQTVSSFLPRATTGGGGSIKTGPLRSSDNDPVDFDFQDSSGDDNDGDSLSPGPTFRDPFRRSNEEPVPRRGGFRFQSQKEGFEDDDDFLEEEDAVRRRPPSRRNMDSAGEYYPEPRRVKEKCWNKVELLGRCANSPSPAGRSGDMMYFNVWTNFRRQLRSGEEVEDSHCHRILAWRKRQLNVLQIYCRPGARVLVTGKLEYRKIQVRDNFSESGTEQQVSYIRADDILFLTPPTDQSRSGSQRREDNEDDFVPDFNR